jgi:hypothetical protein
VQEVEQVMDEETGLDLTAENVEKVLEEIRPYLVGTGGGELGLLDIDGPIVKVKLSGPAATVMVRFPHLLSKHCILAMPDEWCQSVRPCIGLPCGSPVRVCVKEHEDTPSGC